MESKRIIKSIRIAFAGISFSCLCLCCAVFCVPQTDALAGDNSDVGGGGDAVILPVIMYHAIYPGGVKTVNYSISINALIADLDYIKENGYTTVLTQDLVNFTEGKSDLPDKPIMLTFDDGFYSMKSLVLPQLIKRDQRAVCAVVGKFIDKYALHNDKYGYLDMQDIKALAESGHIEIASHTNDMHGAGGRKGAGRLSSESPQQYEQNFKADITKLQDKLAGIGVEPAALAYPYGIRGKDNDRMLKELGFKSSFSCAEKFSKITRDPNCLFWLGRVNRDSRSAEYILKNYK